MSFSIHRRGACRICGASDVPFFLDLGDAPFTDDFLTPEAAGSEFSGALRVAVCRSCWTAQTRHDVDVTDYYRDYRYSVAASGFAQRFMARLAQETLDRYGLAPGASVIEVGSGDGAQLAHFQQRGARVLGFEPSADLCAVSRAEGVPVAECLFMAETVDEIPRELRPADVVLLTYTFDHLPEPLSFLEAVRTVLEPRRGVLVIEVHDLEQIPARERRGNSLLVVAAPKGTEHPVDPPRPLGRDYCTWETYADFGEDVERSHAALCEWVRERRAAGETVAGWGAGGRGVMTLAYTGLDADDVAYLVDRNPHAHGHLAPGSHVPVVVPEHLAANPVDHLVVFSYGYMDEIREQAHQLGSDAQLVSVLDLLRAPAA